MLLWFPALILMIGGFYLTWVGFESRSFLWAFAGVIVIVITAPFVLGGL
jgi:hypothetical protein